ncbi:hypothetical protein L195_g045647, partial [Trifolium pratense]
GKENLEKFTSSDNIQQKDKHITSENPLSELEKHLSPDPLNNHPFTHKPRKPLSPPKPKSPQPQPQIETSTIPSSKPQPDIPATEQTSPIKQISPSKSPEPTSEPAPSEQILDLNPNSGAEHVSPERVHTCAPRPSEVDVIQIDNSTPESPQHSTIPYIPPTSSDLFGNLFNQLYDDLLRLSNIKNRFLVCPSDVDVEVSSFKAKVCHALDAVGADIKAVIGKRDMEVVHLMKEGLARVSMKRLTMFNHEETERAKIAALPAAVLRLNTFKDCWVDSKLFKSLEAQRIESGRLAPTAERIAQEAVVLHQEDVLMLDYQEDGGSSSDKCKAPVDADQLRALQEAFEKQQEALEKQRSDHQNLESKVDKLDSKVDTLNDKFDILLALLKKP